MIADVFAAPTISMCIAYPHYITPAGKLIGLTGYITPVL
jgi:hypothetical protein